MRGEVTLKSLNEAFLKEIAALWTFWFGVIFYLIGILSISFSLLIGGTIMLIGSLIMINADWVAWTKLVKYLQWKK